jgi:hypothetical protein
MGMLTSGWPPTDTIAQAGRFTEDAHAYAFAVITARIDWDQVPHRCP